MKRKKNFKIISGIIAFLIMILFFTILFFEHRIEKKIKTLIIENNGKYEITVSKVDVSIFTSAIELATISIQTKPEYKSNGVVNGEIESVKCKGISLYNAIFKNDIDISEVIISNSSIKNLISDSAVSGQSPISSLNIKIGKINFDRMSIEIKKSSSAQTYSLIDGVLNVYNIEVSKNDTISNGIIKKFDFKADKLISTLSDSMYVLSVNKILYSTNSNTLSVDSFLIHPNYKGYDFTSRQKFQTDCIEAVFRNIYIHNISAIDYINSKSLVSSYIEIGKMDINVFRDLREKPSHALKPMFQELIYNYPGKINIDSLGLLNGNVTYTEHAIKANHPGRISFNDMDAKIYKISNDTFFKKGIAYFELRSNALLMGKGKLSVLLKSRLFDSRNTFSLTGTLSNMEAKDLNPMLERNAFIYAASGKIDKMNFAFTANNNKSTGRMTMLYHGLDVAVKNKESDDTTAIKEIIVSAIANIKIINSNPLPGKEVRVGVIEFKRDHEAFLFNYCFKSILSGIKSSIFKGSSGEKKNSSAHSH